ncbi:20071_t:CDS:2 [Entrophospora sp. SA101]|nr:20071_t:CDS:2 [Entrophospora sp. SA101]
MKFVILANSFSSASEALSWADFESQHLDYLVENEINLLKRKGDDDSDDDSGNSTGIGISGGMYYIQYQKVMETIKQELFEDIISKKYDHTGTRVVRLLHMKDKLEEKAIATFTLMTASDDDKN